MTTHQEKAEHMKPEEKIANANEIVGKTAYTFAGPIGDPELFSDNTIRQALRKLHSSPPDRQVAFGKTFARQKDLAVVSDDLPPIVYLASAKVIRAEAKRRKIAL